MAPDNGTSGVWRPGLPITADTHLSDIAHVLAEGQQDDAFNVIASLLSKRGCVTIGHWCDWSKGEFFEVLKTKPT